MKKLDKNTFGSSKAAVNLIKILEEYSEYAPKACSILSIYFSDFQKLLDIADSKVRNQALLLWRIRFLGRVKEGNFPEVLKTHMSNLIVARHRASLRQ